MGFGAPQVVDGHPRAALPFGLFSVVTFRESADDRWMSGIEWEALACAPVSAVSGIGPEGLCLDMEVFFQDFGDTGEAAAFDVYGSALCGVPGGRADLQAEERAGAQLLAREEAQAEALLWMAMAAQAVDLNAAGALAPEKGLAALEEWMGSVYGNLGVIHAPRRVASLWSTSRLQTSGASLHTKIGTPVVSGAGYPGSSPDGAAPAAGERWAFASPALFGYRGSVHVNSVLDHTRNDYYALAQRPYVVGFDPCGVAAVRITV